MRIRVAATVLLAGLALPAPGAFAQVVRGEVVTRDSVPVRGAILVLMDSLGAEPARALTGVGGVFELRAPRAGTYRLRVEAVGYASVLSLPFGVRDGVSSAGNFGARSQFTQTRHGKALIGGYLSRISARRVEKMRQDYPTLDALIKLSEPAPLGPEVADTLRQRGNRLVSQANLGYVVIDAHFIPEDRARMVIEAFKLRPVASDQQLTLYVPETAVAGLR